MNNLEKMKESICNQIKEMNSEEFYNFLVELELDELEMISLDDILTCPQCKELYGYSCANTDEKPCLERFKHYCEQ